MLDKSLDRAILVGVSMTLLSSAVQAQLTDRGLSPAANTARSYQDSSLVRDSGLNRPLDLLSDFYPVIEVSIADHDNVRRRPNSNEDDIKLLVKPSLAYRTNLGRHQLYAAYSGTFTFHDDFDSEDSDANDVSVRLGLDVSRSWDIDAFVSAGNAFEQRGISGSREFDIGPSGNTEQGPDRIDYRRYGADFVYGRKLNHVSVIFGIERSETGFQDDDGGGAILAGNRDRESDSIHLDLNYSLGAKTSVFGRVQQTDVDYDRSFRSLDNEQTDYLVGVRWKPTNRLSGVLGVGRTDRDFDDATLEGFDGNNYYANINFALKAFSNIQLAANRAIEEPSDLESNFFESELFGINWDHAITPHLILNAYSKWIDDDYDSGREDKFVDWGVGIDYAWRPWLTAGIYYGEIELDSNREDIEYDDSFIGLRFRSDLRSLLKRRSKDVITSSSFFRSGKSGTSK